MTPSIGVRRWAAMRPSDRGRDTAGRGASGPFPMPIGPALAAVLLLTLVVDRTLGLTRFAVTTDLPLPSLVDLGRGAALLADLVTVSIVVGVLLLIDALTRPRSRGGLLLLLIGVALVALQAGTVVTEAVTDVALVTDLQLARALLLAGTTMATIRVLGALAEHRGDSRALSEATARAEALASAGRTAIAALRDDATARVRAVMGDAIDTLSASAASDPSTAARLRALAADVLRPLSHRLAASPVPVPDVTPSVAPPRWRDTLVAVGRSPVIPARSLALIAAGLAWLRTLITDQERVRELAPADPSELELGTVGITLTVDWVSLSSALGELGLVLLLTWWGAARFAEILEDGRTTLGPWVAWVATILGLAAISVLTLVGPALFAWLAGTTAGAVGPAAFLASFVPLLAVTLGVTFLLAVEEQRETFAHQLVRENLRASRAAARTQAVLAHEQHRLARTLHADVQAAVNAASLVLDRAAREDTVTPQVIDEAAGRIASAVERFLGSGASEQPLVERLAEVRAVWDGVCSVEVDVVPEVADRIDHDPVTRELLVDLVAEGCANAVVHGGAGEVHVVLAADAAEGTAADADEVVLTVADDGTRFDRDEALPLSAGTRRGLGSEVLRASCTRFTLGTTDRGSTLTASVPLGRAAP